MEKKRKNDVPKPLNDDYKELDYMGYRMDKDDALEKFLPYHVVDIVKFKRTDIVSVLMGTYEPIILLEDDVREFAKEKAEFKLKSRCDFINESDVIVNGQGELAYRLFTFKKYLEHYY